MRDAIETVVAVIFVVALVVLLSIGFHECSKDKECMESLQTLMELGE